MSAWTLSALLYVLGQAQLYNEPPTPTEPETHKHGVNIIPRIAVSFLCTSFKIFKASNTKGAVERSGTLKAHVRDSFQ